MEKNKISYFDTTSKLLRNLENCADKEIDIHFTKEALKTLISIMKTQNELLEHLTDLDETIELVSNSKSIVTGMLVYIKNRKLFGKVTKIDEQNEIYFIRVLGSEEEETLKVKKEQFNI